MKTEHYINFLGFELKNFNIETLKIESQSLLNNPLGDSSLRFLPTLVPKDKSKIKNVVLVLAGFTGVGSKYFNVRFKEESFPEVIDHLVEKEEAPNCVYAFVDAMTYWGGSQFIDSVGTGNYEAYLVNEVYQALKNQYDLNTASENWCVMGGSSGGYGALHLVSKYPEKFGYSIAIAPDSFFDLSLLPEIYSALPVMEKIGGIEAVKSEMDMGKFMSRKGAHTVLNAIGMGTCYAPDGSGGIQWPINIKTGIKNEKLWAQWKSYDPIEFLKERNSNVKKVAGFYLDVGDRDQYFLQYGTRQIYEILNDIGACVDYFEFNGGHFDISKRRPEALAWLKSKGF